MHFRQNGEWGNHSDQAISSHIRALSIRTFQFSLWFCFVNKTLMTGNEISCVSRDASRIFVLNFSFSSTLSDSLFIFILQYNVLLLISVNGI